LLASVVVVVVVVIIIIIVLFVQNTGCGFLLNSMFDFAERFNELQLTDEEIALFSALIIISAGTRHRLLLSYLCFTSVVHYMRHKVIL